MRYILSLIALVVLMSCMTACGSKTSGEESETVAESVDEQNTQLAEALNVGNIGRASAMADSMSLFVDDFTPEQTVQVLMAFLSVHNDAVAAKERRRDLETIRKYIDVYDIAVSTNPKDTRAAFAKAKRINPEGGRAFLQYRRHDGRGHWLCYGRAVCGRGAGGVYRSRGNEKIQAGDSSLRYVQRGGPG